MAALSYGAVPHGPVEVGAFPARCPAAAHALHQHRGRNPGATTPTAALHERITLTSYRREPLDVTPRSPSPPTSGLFNLRAFAAAKRGTYGPTTTPAPGRIVLSYSGRDGLQRYTVCNVAPAPDTVTPQPPSPTMGSAPLRRRAYTFHRGSPSPSTW